MAKDLKSMLADYDDYVSIFSLQIYSPEMWSEQTGCELDEYCDYVKCCESKLYTFGTWFEHTTSEEYPTGTEWSKYNNFRPELLRDYS